MLLLQAVSKVDVFQPNGCINRLIVYPSEMTKEIVKATEDLKRNPEAYASQVSPLGRHGNAQDIAGCILWLASKAGSWLSGMVVVTDGGKLSITPSTY